MLKTKMNKLLLRIEKERKQRLISRIKFQIDYEDSIKLQRLCKN